MDTDTALTHDAPRPLRRLVLDPTVGTYFWAKLGASIGIWIYNVVAAVLVYELTGSALLVGAVSVAQFLPQVLLTPWAGALADRGNRRLWAAGGRFVSAAGAGVLAVGFVVLGADGMRGEYIIGAALFVGVGFAFSVPSMYALLPALGRPGELPGVIAIDNIPFTIARAAGPALGALLLNFTGAAFTFAVVVVCQASFGLVIALLRLRPVERTTSRDGSVMAGIRYLRIDPVVGLLLLAVLGIGFGVDPVITLTPPLAEEFGNGARLVAIMVSAFGAGAAVAPMLLGSLRRRMPEPRIGLMGMGLMVVSLLALAASPGPETAVVSLFVGGMGMLWAVTSVSTQVQERVPDALRGRVMALWVVCFVGARPIGAMLNGALADFLDVRLALVVVSVLLAIVTYVSRPRRDPSAPVGATTADPAQ